MNFNLLTEKFCKYEFQHDFDIHKELNIYDFVKRSDKVLEKIASVNTF